MRTWFLACAALAAACSAASTTPPDPITTAASPAASDVPQSAPLPLAEVGPRGREIFERDRAAWVATDAMLASGVDPTSRGVGGWITEPADDGWKVIFVRQRGEELAPAFEAWTSDGDVVRSAWADADAAPLTPPQARAFRARQTAAASIDTLCSPNANTVVIPLGGAADPEAFDVYVLSAPMERDVVVAGGHSRVRVSGDGAKIEARRAFTNSCINMQRQPNAVAFQVSHIRADTPEEIHVFVSLSSDLPVSVVTVSNGTVWMVEGEQVRELHEDEDI